MNDLNNPTGRTGLVAIDKRGAFATLTDAGMAVLEAAAPSHVESVRRHVFDVLSSTQVAELGAISRAIAGALACPGAEDAEKLSSK